MDCPPLESLGKFGTLMMDPPWRTVTWDGKSAVPTLADDPYPTMTLAEMKALDVPAVAEKNCVLHMWVIDTHLEQALELGKHYGFRYSTIGFIWDKMRQQMGMGKWTRKDGEICLLFVKGKPKCTNHGVRQFIREPTREHSRKPDGQYHRIEDLSDGPYLELFGRQARPGWITWGREAGLFDGRGMPINRELGPLLTWDDILGNVVHDD